MPAASSRRKQSVPRKTLLCSCFGELFICPPDISHFFLHTARLHHSLDPIPPCGAYARPSPAPPVRPLRRENPGTYYLTPPICFMKASRCWPWYLRKSSSSFRFLSSSVFLSASRFSIICQRHSQSSQQGRAQTSAEPPGGRQPPCELRMGRRVTASLRPLIYVRDRKRIVKQGDSLGTCLDFAAELSHLGLHHLLLPLQGHRLQHITSKMS